MTRMGLASLILLIGCGVPSTQALKVQLPVDPPSRDGAMAPNLAADGAGLVLTWLEPDGDSSASKALRIARLRSSEGAFAWSPALTVATGRNFFANWADVPSAVVTSRGGWMVHWLEKSGPGTYAYDVMLSSSADEGRTWSVPRAINDDGTETEHGFVSLIPEKNGARAFWLDGRAMVQKDGAMALRTALLGESIAESELLDPRACECCQTGAAMTSGGPVVVYRDRTESELRDISVVRREGAAWSAPASIHDDAWEVPGCPVNGPSIVSDGSEGRRIAVAWYTAAKGAAKVKVVFSDDGGQTFGQPVIVDEGQPAGRVDVALDREGNAIVGWLASGGDRSDGKDAAIRLRRVGQDGRVGEPMTLATVGAERGSGFPRLASIGALLAAVWTDPGPPARLRAVVLPQASVPGLAAASTSRATGVSGAAAPQEATDYEAMGLDARQFSLAQYRGEAVLLNVWATWCLPCRTEIPQLVALHRKWAGRGLRVIGVSVDEAGRDVEVHRFVEAQGIPYTIVRDMQDRASRQFGLTMLPGTLLFDRSGRLIWRRDGVIEAHDRDLAGAVERALAPPGNL